MDDITFNVNILDVGDADAIVINYFYATRWWTAVIDAGNVGDGGTIKQYIKHKENNKYIIDYAFCTHPDKDHKGGFFDLFDDSQINISNFVLANPEKAMENDYRRLLYESGTLASKAKSVYNHPTDASRNLIDIARRNSHLVDNWNLGVDFVGIPIMIVGPTSKFYQDSAYEMTLKFAELEDESNAELYNEDEVLDDRKAKSIIDGEKEESPTNKSSLILLFHPKNHKFLFTGDACSKSIHDAIDLFGENVTQCILKVPHHGSKHNLTTEVIDLLSPVSAVISCKGSRKHPNSSIVYWLSKHCNVYATSKSQTLIYNGKPPTNPAIPLKKKQD